MYNADIRADCEWINTSEWGRQTIPDMYERSPCLPFSLALVLLYAAWSGHTKDSNPNLSSLTRPSPTTDT